MSSRIDMCRAVVLSLCFLSLCHWTVPASARNATPIEVAVSISSDSLRRAWGDRRVAEIEAGLASFVAGIFADRFDHWDFDTDFSRHYASIELVIRETQPRKIYLEMHKMHRDSELLWRQVWLEPADFIMGGRRPASEKAETALRGLFEAYFDQPKQQIVEDWLRKVPLGARGKWTVVAEPVQVRVITSLRWERFSKLERSRFKVSCRRGGQQIELETEGVGEPRPYKDASGDQYDALVMKPTNLAGGRVAGVDVNEISNFRVGPVFLLEEREAVDDDFFDLYPSR